MVIKKKMVGNRKLIFVFSLVLLFSLFLSISFVSANVFSDFFNKIFGGNKQVSLSPESCQKNSDCLNIFKVCENSLCVVKSCSIDSGCPTDTKCLGGVCVQPMCDGDFSTCGTNPNNPGVCFNYLCLKKQCSLNIDCPNNYDFIEIGNGQSAISCQTDLQCPYGMLCNSVRCIEPDSCRYDSDCYDMGNSDSDNRKCVNSICVNTLQTGSNQGVCNKGLCFKSECNVYLSNSCGDGKICINSICNDIQCRSDSECNPGQICDSNFQCVCNPSCSGITCGKNNQCGNVCGTGSGCTTPPPTCTPQCAGKKCGASNGCPGGTCQAGSGCKVCTNPKRC